MSQLLITQYLAELDRLKKVSCRRLWTIVRIAFTGLRQDLAFETTLAGRGHLALMKRLRAEGWRGSN